MSLTVKTVIEDTRQKLDEAATDRFMQDWHVLKAIHTEILELENWLALIAPEWVGYYDATTTISVVSDTWKYALSSDIVFHRVRATYSGVNQEEDLSIGAAGRSRYWVERIGEYLYVNPIPAESFTLTLYKRATLSGSLPTTYAADLVGTSSPVGFPFWCESYFRARVIATMALSCIAKHPKFEAMAKFWSAKADKERESVEQTAWLQKPFQSHIRDTSSGTYPDWRRGGY